MRHVLSVALAFAAALTALAGDQQPATQKAAQKIKEVAGTAEFLRQVPKRFATLKAVDVLNRLVTLLIEGETLPKVWPLIPDVEIKRAGWWARLEQLRIGDRVWVWFKTDRKRQPSAVSMLCDELSEQDMHGPGITIVSVSADNLTLKPEKDLKKGGVTWSIKTEKAELFRGQDKAGLDTLKVGERIYAQSADGRARILLDAAALEARRAEQKLALRKLWTTDGLPGTVAFAHVFSGEMDLLLDHEAMRWGRSLKTGDKVSLAATPPINAIVKHVKPWRERTAVRLVVHSFDLADLANGQRVHMKMTPPPAEVQTATLPPDLDQPRQKLERVEWFLASIYCTCKVKGDGCTGHFYTLASCNPNACGMPNHMRKVVTALIDRGLADAQVFEQLLKEHGPDLFRPHLLP